MLAKLATIHDPTKACGRRQWWRLSPWPPLRPGRRPVGDRDRQVGGDTAQLVRAALDASRDVPDRW